MQPHSISSARPPRRARPTAPDTALVDAMSEPALCLDEELEVVHANARFGDVFKASTRVPRRSLRALCEELGWSRSLEALCARAIDTGSTQQARVAGGELGLDAVVVPQARGAVLILRAADHRAGTAQALFASSVVAALRCTADGRVSGANRACRDLLQRDVTGTDTHWLELVAASDRTRAAACDAALRDEGRFGSTELALDAGGGRTVPVIAIGCTSAEDGAATLLFLDISDRKYAEQSQAFIAEAGRVLASSLDYEKTLDEVARLSVPAYADWCLVDVVEDVHAERVVVAHADPAHRAVAAALPRRFSVPAATLDDLRTQHRVDLTDPRADDPADAPGLAPLLAVGVRSYMVVPMLARQRLVGFLTFASSRWNYDARNLACAEELARRAAICIDNARLYRDAQLALRAREDFLSTASHELKTPLTALRLQVHSLLRLRERHEELSQERLLRSCELIGRQVERQCQLVDILLDVSRIGADRLALEPDRFDLGELVGEIVARFQTERTDSGSRLVLHCPESIVVDQDRLRVDQVLTNLVSNALKYGEGRPVEVTCTGGADEAVIVVRDHGIGIRPDDQARIFDRFERAVSHRNYGGIGLGLWIANRIIRSMGGEVTVDSQLGEGSTFTVRLPREAPRATPSA